MQPGRCCAELTHGTLWAVTPSGWWARATPLKNMSQSIGMMTFPILMGKCKKWQPNHQPEKEPIIHRYSHLSPTCLDQGRSAVEFLEWITISRPGHCCKSSRMCMKGFTSAVLVPSGDSMWLAWESPFLVGTSWKIINLKG